MKYKIQLMKRGEDFPIRFVCNCFIAGSEEIAFVGCSDGANKVIAIEELNQLYILPCQNNTSQTK